MDHHSLKPPPSPPDNPANWAVCAVCLPRESYYWLKDWIDHHIMAGAQKVVIYDNTGSTCSLRSGSSFAGGKLQRSKLSKRKEEYGRLTEHLSDKQIQRELRELAATYNGMVDIIDWHPKHPRLDTIIHGQVEAFCDFIRRYRNTIRWGFFTDLDEYIYCKPGIMVNSTLKWIEEKYPQVSALHLFDWRFECRWGQNGPKNISLISNHHPGKKGFGKMLARLQDMTHANNHLDWKLKKGTLRLTINRNDMGFTHYNMTPCEMGYPASFIQPRAFLNTPEQEGVHPSVSFKCSFYDLMIPALPIDTTFVEMYKHQQ